MVESRRSWNPNQVDVYANWVPKENILATNTWSSELSKLVANGEDVGGVDGDVDVVVRSSSRMRMPSVGLLRVRGRNDRVLLAFVVGKQLYVVLGWRVAMHLSCAPGCAWLTRPTIYALRRFRSPSSLPGPACQQHQLHLRPVRGD